ncbi:MAG: hypothetical protein HKK67_13715 [Chlorobiaceae bacterium]|nr:hypothetical protein [Chlorobiaceae bacterium]
MVTENKAARFALIGTIITVLGGIIVALITVFGTPKQEKKSDKPDTVSFQRQPVNETNINSNNHIQTDGQVVITNQQSSK